MAQLSISILLDFVRSAFEHLYFVWPPNVFQKIEQCTEIATRREILFFLGAVKTAHLGLCVAMIYNVQQLEMRRKEKSFFFLAR